MIGWDMPVDIRQTDGAIHRFDTVEDLVRAAIASVLATTDSTDSITDRATKAAAEVRSAFNAGRLTVRQTRNLAPVTPSE